MRENESLSETSAISRAVGALAKVMPVSASSRQRSRRIALAVTSTVAPVSARIAGQSPGQCGAAAFAPAGAVRFAGHVDTKLSGDGLNLVPGRGIGTVQGKVHQRLVPGKERVLFQHDDFGSRLDRALAPVRLDLPRDQPQQRGLARSVAPDQRQPIARADVQVEILEQPAGALDQAEAFISENGCGHAGGLDGNPQKSTLS